MAQLMFSYLAGGFRGFGFWCWNSRTAGWEAGEYALLDRNNKPSPRAIRAGQIGKATRRLRDELWQAHKEPVVGLLVDWDNDAMWAAIAVAGRDDFKHFPIRARMGAARAFSSANIPWEHVTANDLRAGIAARYPAIYLPAILSLSSDLLHILTEYARGGGRIIVDSPSAWFDEWGRLFTTSEGSAWEQLFGVVLCDVQYSSNVPRTLDGDMLSGFIFDLKPTTASIVTAYDGGGAAVTENQIGDGSAVVLGFDASLACGPRGAAALHGEPAAAVSKAAEARLVRFVMQGRVSSYSCSGATVYRLAAPLADHYFFINDGAAKSVALETLFCYSHATDAETEQTVQLHSIALEANGGRWLRCEK
jgi:beta-galactosidase